MAGRRRSSVSCSNTQAELGKETLHKLVARASGDVQLATDLRGRADIDWNVDARRDRRRPARRCSIPSVPARDRSIRSPPTRSTQVVYNRMRNRAGFSAQEWKVAYNQVKALSDRRQLDERALVRFARFGYGHHSAAALTVLLNVSPEVFVKWLAMQDYVATTVALRALDLKPDLFEALIATMPWRDMPTDADKTNVRRRYEALTRDEASGIFELWRSHAFRRKPAGERARRLTHHLYLQLPGGPRPPVLF